MDAGPLSAEDAQLRVLQEQYMLLLQGRIREADLNNFRVHASPAVNARFDAWLSRPAPPQQQPSPARVFSAPQPGPFAPPLPLQQPAGRVVYSSGPAPSSSAAQPTAQRLYAVEPTSFCPHCREGIMFSRPPDANPKRVVCPFCNQVSSFQKCWTCPATIVFDSTCASCMARDAAPAVPQLLLRPEAAAVSVPRLEPAPVLVSTPPREEKGLRNRAGENNCFLNVTIQSLWHLPAFRDKFQEWHVKHAPQCNCVHCALTFLFTQYKFGSDNVLAPTALRRTLDVLYAAEAKFQMGDLSDATECFDAICSCLHDVAVSDAANGNASPRNRDQCRPSCAVHDSFCLLVEERTMCKKCGTRGTNTESMFLHYAYEREILKARFNKSKSLGKTLRKLHADKQRSCTTPKCLGVMDVQKVLLKPYPPVFTLAICWAESDPPLSEISAFMGSVDEELDLCEVYLTADEAGGGLRKTGNKRKYRLRGIVCYYLKHYVACFLGDKDVWYSFDDVSVHELGRDWRNVVAHSKRGHLKPVLIFYERVAGGEDNTPSPQASRVHHRSLLDRLREHGTLRINP